MSDDTQQQLQATEDAARDLRRQASQLETDSYRQVVLDAAVDDAESRGKFSVARQIREVRDA